MLLLILCLSRGFAQAPQTEVLSLGTFHFEFYNLDIEKTAKEDQIDVLDPKYQEEIEDIVSRLVGFKPTIIAIEAGTGSQAKYDSLYRAYLDGRHELRRDEREQIGFRVAKQAGLETLHCVNDWGRGYADIDELMNGSDTMARQKFIDYFYHSPDSHLIHHGEQVFKTKGILEQLRLSNDEENIKKDLGNYLISVFKYETEDNPQFGVDFTSGWWFNRNLRIFRNIQRINPTPEDRILVIFGSGHLNILNPLFDASPEFMLVPAKDYLE